MVARMKFIWFLALRYLKPRGTFFSVITLLSVLGVLLGVAVLIVVIGVMSGFERTIKNSILGLQPPIVLNDSFAPFLDEKGEEVPRPEEFLNWRKAREVIKKMPHVREVQPYINLVTLIEPKIKGRFEPQVANFLGLDPENEDQIGKIKAMMIKPEEGGGEFDIGSVAGKKEGEGGENIVMNVKLAEKLGVGVGDTVNAFSPESMKEVRQAWERWEASKDNPDEKKTVEDQMHQLLVPNEYIIAGLFTSLQHPDFVIFSLDNGQTLSGKAGDDYISGLAVMTDDPFEADIHFREMLHHPAMPPNWGGHTWIDANRNFFNAIQNERSMMFLVLMIIIVVAAFSTMISMIIFAFQKKREIGMIRALGARLEQVVGIFVAQGMVIAFIGVSLGVAAGLLILHYRNGIRAALSENLNIEIFPADIYGLPELPSYLRPEDVMWICIPAFLLCSLASLYPAIISAIGDPSKELRGGAA